MTTHIMLDIETLGTRSGFCVLSAAFVRFNDLAATHVVMDTVEQRALGLEVDNDTLRWWGEQDPRAWAAATTGSVPLLAALTHFGEWLKWAANGGDMLIWCHGAAFDTTMLGEVYRRTAVPCPWTFRQVRDTRTLYDLAGVNPKQFQTGTVHNALDDAVTQTRAAIEAMRVLAGRQGAAVAA